MILQKYYPRTYPILTNKSKPQIVTQLCCRCVANANRCVADNNWTRRRK